MPPTPPEKPIYSLWLLPPADTPLTGALTDLTTKSLPPSFPGFAPKFRPHITLCSQIPISDTPLLDKLGDLPLPKVSLEEVTTGNTFFTRVVIRLDKKGVVDLARYTREQLVGKDGIDEWTEKYWPHLSLVYNDEPATEEVLERVRKEVAEKGIEIGGKGDKSGWEGGSIALVETYKKVEEWEIHEIRKL